MRNLMGLMRKQMPLTFIGLMRHLMSNTLVNAINIHRTHASFNEPYTLVNSITIHRTHASFNEPYTL